MINHKSDKPVPRWPVQWTVRFVLTVLIATLLGPFIGAIVMMLGRIGLDLARWEFDPADIHGVIVIFMMGAYAAGGVIALAAGLLVALAALWREATFATAR